MISSHLTPTQLRQLQEDLRRRQELLRELAALNVKRLAAKYGISGMTVRRYEFAVCGCQLCDPKSSRARCEMPSV